MTYGYELRIVQMVQISSLCPALDEVMFPFQSLTSPTQHMSHAFGMALKLAS